MFDSYPMTQTDRFRVNYCNEKIFVDDNFRKDFMNKVAEIGVAIENHYNEAQDIEGCYYDGKFYVVQTRPQV